MGARGWVLLGLLSAAPSVLPGWLAGAQPWLPAGASIYGLSLLPWLAMAGLPMAPQAEEGSRPRLGLALFPLALALPILSMGVGLDLAQGRLTADSSAELSFLLGGPVLILAWRMAAWVASAHGRARACQAWLWGLMLPLGSAWICAKEWAPPALGEPGPGGSAWLRFLNPLMWCLERTGYQAAMEPPPAQWGRLSLLVALALLSAGLALGAPRRERP